MASLPLLGCGGDHGGRRNSVQADAAASSSGYATPPRVLAAQRLGDQVVISGRAQPDGRVRLMTPDGEAFGGTVGADGGWSMPAPTAGGPRLYAVGEDLGGRVVRAEGAVAALPSGRPAALLRAGAGAQALGPSSHAIQIGAVDYDEEGWAFVSGQFTPGAAVSLQVDSAPPTQAKTDAEGRFAFTLKPAELPPGPHRLLTTSGAARAVVNVAISPASPISATPYLATRQPGGWRIDWRTPGGGVQTSLILDP